ncbi:MAG: hypothetical protein ACE10C_06805 [Candidatus Binatia bacterium]
MSTDKPTKKSKPEEIETDPGAWERFEHAVDAAVRSGPKHRVAPKPHKPGRQADLEGMRQRRG